MAVDGLAAVGVAVVTLVGGYIAGRQKASGDLSVALEETARLREEIDAKRFEHRTGVYHNIVALASKIEHSGRHANSVYRGAEGWAVVEQFNGQVDGLAVFGASEPRRHALAMKAVLDRGMEGSAWVDEFAAAKGLFMNAAHEDVGPDTGSNGLAAAEQVGQSARPVPQRRKRRRYLDDSVEDL
jgi:hypothetical protein